MDFNKIQEELERELNSIKLRASDEVTVLSDGTLIFNDDLQQYKELSERQSKINNLKEFVSSNDAILKRFNYLSKDAGVELSEVISAMGPSKVKPIRVTEYYKNSNTKTNQELENTYLDEIKIPTKNTNEESFDNQELEKNIDNFEARIKAAYEQGLKEGEELLREQIAKEEAIEETNETVEENQDTIEAPLVEPAEEPIAENNLNEQPVIEESQNAEIAPEEVIEENNTPEDIAIPQEEYKEVQTYPYVVNPNLSREDQYDVRISNLISKQYLGDTNFTPEDIDTLNYLKNEYKPVKPGEDELRNDLINWAYMNGVVSLKDPVDEQNDLNDDLKDEPENLEQPAQQEAPAISDPEPLQNNQAETTKFEAEPVIQNEVPKISRKVVSQRKYTWKDKISNTLTFIKAIYTCENVMDRTEAYRDISLRIANFRLNHKNKSASTLNAELHTIDDLIRNSEQLTIPEKKTLYKKLAKINRIAERSFAKESSEEILTR